MPEFEMSPLLLLFALPIVAVGVSGDSCQLPGYDLSVLERTTYAIYPENKECPEKSGPCAIVLSLCGTSVFCRKGQQTCLTQYGTTTDLGATPTVAKTDKGFTFSYDKPVNASNAIIEFVCDANKKLDTSESMNIVRVEASKIEHDKDAYRVTIPTDLACEQKPWGLGSQLVLILFIFALLYLGGGVAYNHVNGARGVELIPHHWFWTDFAGHVVDGCMFFVRLVTCQSAPSTSAPGSNYGSTTPSGLSPSGRDYQPM